LGYAKDENHMSQKIETKTQEKMGKKGRAIKKPIVKGGKGNKITKI
jgi:hypothetical protein